METYTYKSLALEKNDIRVLKFVDPPTTSDPNLIHCSLENVSLDDYLADFTQFLEAKGLECGPAATRLWIETVTRQGSFLPDAAPEIPFARWRLDSDRILDTDVFGVKRNSLLERLDTPYFMTDASDLQALATRPTIDRRAELVRLRPRFKWGDFEAVSYCWGSDVRDKTVIVDGQPLRIATNLEAFLQKLRLLPEAQAGTRFWADGICIWQDNTLEKNHQVKLMKRIYTHAYSVVVWLGPFHGEADATFKTFARVCEREIEDAQYGRIEISPGSWEEYSFQSWFRELDLPSLVDILSRDYWKRMWIIQELSLNQHMTAFLCGDLQLSRAMIRLAGRFCKDYCGKIHQFLRSNHANKAVAALWQLGNDTNTLLTLPEYPKLPKLNKILDVSRKSRVKEAKDKVYGMLGLLPSLLVEMNEPDYSLNQTEVYKRFAKSLIMQYDGRKLDATLSWCSFSADNKGPSWVPDWTGEFPRNHATWLEKRQAAAKTINNAYVSSDHSVLSCTGFIVGSVQGTGRSPSENLPYRTQHVHANARSSQKVGFGKYTNLRGLKDALTRTLAQDHPRMRTGYSILDIYWIDWNDIRHVNPDDEQLDDLWYSLRYVTASQEDQLFNWWEEFDRFRQANADFEIFGHQLRDFFPHMTLFWKKPAFWNDPYYKLDEKLYRGTLTEDHSRNMSLSASSLIGKRLVTTAEGHLGLAAKAVQEGDSIAILHGCNFPVVLRRVGDDFRYIGECYIDGLMDGEAIDTYEGSEHDVINII